MGKPCEWIGRVGMITAEIDKDALEAQARKLAALVVDRPEMRKRIRAAIRKELQAARGRLSGAVRGALPNDPRKAYRAVRYAVWKRVLGGNLNILNSRRAGARYWLNRERKVDMNPGMRGGNRRKMSAKTVQMQSYYGKDRGFVLRFVNGGVANGGTANRTILFQSDSHRGNVNRGSQGGDVSKYGRTINTGNRGRITARNFFLGNATAAIEQAAENLGGIIEEELAAAFGA